MQNMQKKYVKPFAICRIVTSPDFAYLSYVCTPHFADVGPSGCRHAGGATVRCAAAPAAPGPDSGRPGGKLGLKPGPGPGPGSTSAA
jgi:hypothetical protein